jgi:conjugative relaxase-like TrwC/TraI family protein
MLSIGRIGTGDGYRYLTTQVASQDSLRAGEKLLSYYERTGYPPGEWIGAGASGFGLEGTVEEAAMSELFGHCADPRTGSPLGRRMAIYKSFEERFEERLAELGHEPSEAERSVIWAEEAAKRSAQAVAGFDLTFSAPKSVSVLFALGDEGTREAVRAAHKAAWTEAFAYFEDQVAATRLGAGGAAQVDIEGVSAAAFEHWYSRAGDPQIHTHVAVSVMVQTTDGRWRRIDSRALYRGAAATGEQYSAALMSGLSDRLGVRWVHRKSGRSDTLVPEIAGVSDELISAFSRRSAAINEAQAGLVADYKARHGYSPDRETLAGLAAQATLASRAAGEHRSFDVSQTTWKTEAAGLLGCLPSQVPGVLATAVRRAPSSAPKAAKLCKLRRGKVRRQATKVLERLEETSATWSLWELRRAAGAQLREAGFRANRAATERVVAQVLELGESVLIVAPGADEAPPNAFRRADGTSIFERRGEARFTSTRVLDAERDLVALARSRRFAKDEQARRARTSLGEIDDNALVAAVRGASAQLRALQRRLTEARSAAAAAELELDRLTAAMAVHDGDTGPELSAARSATAGETIAAKRLAEVQEALGRRGLQRPRAGERAALEHERPEILRRHPGVGESEVLRATRSADAWRTAASFDGSAAAALANALGGAGERAVRAGALVSLLRAELVEQGEGARALMDEWNWRRSLPNRVALEAYIGGLGTDQSDAVIRLADPTRPLDALIGPAGSGKTTALAALVRAFGDAAHGCHVLAPTAVAAAGLGQAVGGAPHSTLYAAVLNWRKGRNLPSRGDLVLIDEASMATTPLLLTAARIAVSRGALVRLIGDPRQLKAVGAGGGLGLVADAVSAPELSELRRFNHEWEASATLGLRRGDSGVLDAYLSHDRIVGALDAVAVEEVFAGWWASAAGREQTLMIASDNATVRVLNTLARAARLEAGEVVPDGVELHDSTLAGVGDVITTRRNDRTLPTRANGGKGAYVRNHDRWRVEGVNADGSLDVSHVEQTARVRLPALYVSEHVELGYADTGHGVQGRTVERAEVLVRPSDTRWYLYVAMTRGREENIAHVALDEVEDEASGYHPNHGPREVLEAVLDRDEPVSALEWRRATDAARSDPSLIADRYRTGAADELRLRLATALARFGEAEVLVGDGGWQVLAAAQGLEAAGGDAPAVALGAGTADVEKLVEALRAAQPSPVGPGWPAALVADVLDAPGPAVHPEVAAWLYSQGHRLERWREDLARRLAAGQEPPPWAAGLGAVPKDAAQRSAWSAQVAQVALYRATHHVEAKSTLGPQVALGSPGSAARTRAAWAAERARSISEEALGEQPRASVAGPGPAITRGPGLRSARALRP